MARLRVRAGPSEVEIDSRDFYVDNDTVGEVIDLVRTHLPGADAPAGAGVLDSLEEAEIAEPELPDGGAEPAPAPARREDIRRSVAALSESGFFVEPRTASETAERLRERGWSAGLLEVSKELASMSSERLIRASSRDRRRYYSVLA